MSSRGGGGADEEHVLLHCDISAHLPLILSRWSPHLHVHLIYFHLLLVQPFFYGGGWAGAGAGAGVHPSRGWLRSGSSLSGTVGNKLA